MKPRKKLENVTSGREWKIVMYAVEPYFECYGCKALDYKRTQGRLRQCGRGKACMSRNRFGRNWKRFRDTQWK